MSDYSSRLALTFSAIGHFFFHYMAAMYYTIVLTMVKDWNQPYHEMIELWTPAFLLIGLAALPAGRLADRWSSTGMLVLMFFGMGAFCVFSGVAQNETQLLILLAGIGLFAAIYHPVGISWLVRMSSKNTGKKLAINGIFGGLGASAAGLISGSLLEYFNWRIAFYAPGAVCLAIGIVMLWYRQSGQLSTADSNNIKTAETESKFGGMISAFLIMLLPMFVIGLIYNSTQALMPKLFEERMVSILSGNMAKIGGMVSVVYAVGAVMQLFGGWLADRFPLKLVYLWCWILQIPLLLLIASRADFALFILVVVLVSLNTAALPPENILLSRFAPKKHQGLAFGLKFVLAFGAGPLGVELIALVRAETGSFEGMLYGLGIAAAVTAVIVMFLPGRTPAVE